MKKKLAFRPRVESLEARRCLAASMDAAIGEATSDVPAEVAEVTPESDGSDPLDTNGDGDVTASDALAVINYLGRSSLLGESESGTEAPANLDANGDGDITALDALVIINQLGEIEPVDLGTGSDPIFTNPNDPFDVDNSGNISADDVDLVLSALELFGPGDLSEVDPEEFGFVDVNADGVLSAADALAVINQLVQDNNDAPDLQENVLASVI